MLRKGLNYAVTSKHSTVADIATVTESACRLLRSGDAQELRTWVINIVNIPDKIKDQNVSVFKVSAEV